MFKSYLLKCDQDTVKIKQMSELLITKQIEETLLKIVSHKGNPTIIFVLIPKNFINISRNSPMETTKFLLSSNSLLKIRGQI